MERLPYPPRELGAPKKRFEDTFRLSQAMLRAHQIQYANSVIRAGLVKPKNDID